MAEQPEQSMEDILASIKRVISEDAGAARRLPPPPEPADPDEEVLELGTPPLEGDPAPEPALLSRDTAQASKAALATLATLRIDPRAGDDTLDGLVREMLRPMLKDWLDANLPDLVERIVAREIARLGGR